MLAAAPPERTGLAAEEYPAMGSLTAHPGENLPVLWEQMEAKRTPVGGDPSLTPLTSYMTLYFPLYSGLAAEAERVARNKRMIVVRCFMALLLVVIYRFPGSFDYFKVGFAVDLGLEAVTGSLKGEVVHLLPYVIHYAAKMIV